MLLLYYIAYCLIISKIEAYSNQLYYFVRHANSASGNFCQEYDKHNYSDAQTNLTGAINIEVDPYKELHEQIDKFLFGNEVDTNDEYEEPDVNVSSKIEKPSDRKFQHYVMGEAFRSELFLNRKGAHLMPQIFIHTGHCMLRVTNDHMQTALNAFSILLHGDINDIGRLPPEYILRSARTISMMSIAREKFAATWEVVKQNKSTDKISYEVLEMFRPLFKYLNGREMARLNLSDDRILSYVGTHSGLDRHQVGVVASRYMKLNPKWNEARYLNKMNNLLCGVPMSYMRKVPGHIYLQLSHQVFYHIKACDPLQRRFYLVMMTRTQALGKSYSWSAQDVFRLGLLLAEVDGPKLATIHPKSMSGITSQVMLTMPAESLQYFNEKQVQYLNDKSLNIFAHKLKMYEEELQLNRCGRVQLDTFIMTVSFIKILKIRFN